MVMRPRVIDSYNVIHYAHYGGDDISSRDCFPGVYTSEPCGALGVTCLVCLSVSHVYCDYGLCFTMVPIIESYCPAHQELYEARARYQETPP